MAELQPYRGYYLWKYLPSIPAAVIFLLLFLASTILISFKIYRTRAWFCIVFAIGGLLEILGYIVRMIAHNRTGQIMPYAIQSLSILLAPVLFAASIYMTLSRIIKGVQADHLSPIRSTRLTKIFVAGDITALLIQGGAAGMMIMVELIKTGQALVIVGLVFHICIFGLFITVTAIFHRRLQATEIRKPVQARVEAFRNPKEYIIMLYTCSGLIMFRSIFRVIEFAMGQDGYLLVNEWPLYVFDSLPMFAVTVVFWKWFPSDLQFVGSGNGLQMNLIDSGRT